MVFSHFGFLCKNTGVLCMCMISHLFIVYLLCNYWMIMLHWYNTCILYLKRIEFLYYWFTPPLSNPTIGIRAGSFRKHFNHWKEIMDYSKNGVPMFNGQNGFKYEMWSRRTKVFYRHRDIIFGYQLLQDMIVQKGKRLQRRRNWRSIQKKVMDFI